MIPALGGLLRYFNIKWLLGRGPHLEIIAAGVRSATQHKDAPVFIIQIRRKAVGTHIGADGDSIGEVAIKSFFCIVLCSRPNISTLGIQNPDMMRMAITAGLGKPL